MNDQQIERVARAIATADLVPMSWLSVSDLQSQGFWAMAKAAYSEIKAIEAEPLIDNSCS